MKKTIIVALITSAFWGIAFLNSELKNEEERCRLIDSFYKADVYRDQLHKSNWVTKP